MDGFSEDGATGVSITCVRCDMSEDICMECSGQGYTLGIGNRKIECKNGRHYIYHVENSKMSPRGTLKWASVEGKMYKVTCVNGDFKLI